MARVLGLCLLAYVHGQSCDETQLLQRASHEKLEASKEAKANAPDGLRYRVIPIHSDRDAYFKYFRPVKTSLCIAGGGTRAMAGVAGQMRALSAMGLLDKVDSVFATAGGTLTPALYYFSDKTDPELLGANTYEALASLTLENIENATGEILLTATAKIAPYLVAAFLLGVPDEQVYGKALAGTVLCPSKLNGEIPRFDLVPIPNVTLCWNDNKDQVWTTGERRLKYIQARNPDLNVSDALVMKKKLRTLAFRSTLLSPVGYKLQGEGSVSIRFGPDVSGSPYYADDKTVDYESQNASAPPLTNVVVGGGLVEAFAFGATDRPAGKLNRRGRRVVVEADLKPEGLFSLQDAIALSSDIGWFGVVNPVGLGQFLNNLGLGRDWVQELTDDPYLLLSRGKYWPVGGNLVNDAPVTGDTQERNYYMTDGLSIESTGLLDAIRSGSECAVLLTNNQFPFDLSLDKVGGNWCNASGINTSTLLDPDDFQFQFFYEYFGVAIGGRINALGSDLSHNQVFDTALLFDLFCEAQQQLAQGKQAVVHKTYTTLENKYWGIDAGKTIDVVFVWTEMSQNWLSQLPNETQAAIEAGNFSTPSPGSLPFPHINTLGPAGATYDPQAVKPEQGNLYASLAEYSLRTNEDKLRKCMGLPATPATTAAPTPGTTTLGPTPTTPGPTPTTPGPTPTTPGPTPTTPGPTEPTTPGPTL